ncbi:MAG: M48 family metalloprotease [Acidimicrobiales bacterium]|nr:M48 family metalloprotease [Acidimicrobiales bacterium]
MNRPDPALIKANYSRSQRLAMAVFAVPFVVLAIILVLLLPWWLGLIIALVAPAAYVLWRLNGAEARIVQSVRGFELSTLGPDHVGAARLENLVEGLIASAGVREPALYAVEDPAVNALVVGRSGDRAALVITTGALDAFDRVELEAVVAQLLVQIRTADVVPRTVAAALLAPVASMAASQYDRVVGRIVDPDRRFRNDALGAAITRYPPGLVAAYERVMASSTKPAVSPHVVEHLWMVGTGEGLGTHPPTETRIAALREL